MNSFHFIIWIRSVCFLGHTISSLYTQKFNIGQNKITSGNLEWDLAYYLQKTYICFNLILHTTLLESSSPGVWSSSSNLSFGLFLFSAILVVNHWIIKSQPMLEWRLLWNIFQVINQISSLLFDKTITSYHMNFHFYSKVCSLHCI